MSRRRTSSSYKPPAGDNSLAYGLQTGVVTALTGDPKGKDRIQVRLPSNVALPILWVRIAAHNTGTIRETFFRPEIGDEVIVGFIDNDPLNAVILGMFQSSEDPSPIDTNDDEEKSISFETTGGNKIKLSDDKQGILLEDQNGNKIEMGPDGITILSAGNFKLKTGGDLEISGTVVDIKSSSSVKVSGNSAAKVSSGGITEIQGSLVKIN